MTVVVDRRADFTLDSFRRVAFAGEQAEIGAAAREAMAAARRGFVALLDSEAGRLAGVFQAGAVTGRLDFAEPGAAGRATAHYRHGD